MPKTMAPVATTTSTSMRAKRTSFQRSGWLDVPTFTFTGIGAGRRRQSKRIFIFSVISRWKQRQVLPLFVLCFRRHPELFARDGGETKNHSYTLDALSRDWMYAVIPSSGRSVVVWV